MKGSKVVSLLIIVSAFIITSCDLFVTDEDKEKSPNYGPASGPLSGEISITPSSPFLGDTLSVLTSASNVGIGNSVVYRWERSDTENGEWEGFGYISTYSLTALDVGKYFRVTVSDYLRPGSITSQAVYVGIHSLAGSVSINGNAVEDETLTADTGSLEGFGVIRYQWERADTADATDWMIILEGTSTGWGGHDKYKVTPEDVGKYIRLTVTRAGNTGSITSEATTAVAFKIYGLAFVGHDLSCGYGSENSSYQWERADTADGEWIAIIGNDSLWYLLDEADLGKYIRLTITRADNTRIYSNVVGPILLPGLTGTVSISKTANVNIGDTLLANTSDLGGSGEISYQWKRLDVASNIFGNMGDNLPVYTVVREDTGKQIYVTVTRSKNSGSITSDKTNAIGIAPLTGTVSVSGTFNVDAVLTAVTSSLGGSGEISYQWQRRIYSGGAGGSYSYPNIVGSNSPTYTITDEDVGGYVRVTVTRANNTGSISSDVNRNVITKNLSGTVSITGDTAIGATLTANTSSLKGKGTITYQWTSGGATVGGNSSTYTIAGADFDKTIRVTVSRSDRDGSVSSSSTDKVYKLPLTGTVSISGTAAAVGETLTAGTGSLGGSGAFSFQWQLGDTANGPWTNILNATSHYYAPVLAQEGKYIRVTVTRADNTGSVSSEGQGPIVKIPLTGTVSIGGTVAVEQTLSAYISDNLKGSGTITYQWERAGAATGPWATVGSNSSNYQLVGDDLGKYVRVTVTRANNTGSVSSEATSPVAPPLLTGTVSISGTAAVEQTLTANISSLGGSGTITYQWLRASSINGPWTDVGIDSSYSLTSVDLGAYIRLTVSRSGNSGSVSSTTSAVALPLLSGTVSINGTAKAGETLTAVTDSLGGSGTITYRWQRGDTADASAWTNIGTNSATYIPVAADAGKYIRLTVSRSGNSGDVTSSATSAVTIDAISGTVSISGTAKAGNTLTAVTGSLRGAITYQWQVNSSGTWTNIGSNSATYIPVKANRGASIRVIVSSNYYTGSLTSNATSAVTVDPLTGSVTIKWAGDRPTLIADTSDLGGSGTITYKWESSMSLILLTAGLGEDLGASGSTYTYNILQLMHHFRVTVTRANNDGEKSDTYYVTIF